MTSMQFFALSMPLIAAAMVGLTALFVRRPWSERPVEETASLSNEDMSRDVMKDRLVAAEQANLELREDLRRVIQKAERGSSKMPAA
jgi:hypothetical protein